MYAYGRWLSQTYGIGVQVTAHLLDSNNPHFHITISSCAVMPDGTLGKKVRDLDPIAMQHDHRVSPAETLRAKWADMVNKAYAENAVAEHVDHRSYERRGIRKIPTVHEGIWHYAPCPVNSPVMLNATINEYNLAVQEEEALANQKKKIEKELKKPRQEEIVSIMAASKKSLEPTPHSDTPKQSKGHSATGPVSVHSSRSLNAPKPVEQKRVMSGVSGQTAGREKRTLLETADKKSATVALQLERKPVKQTTPKEVKPVSASVKVSVNSLKGNLAMGNAAAQPSSPQNPTVSQTQQASWYSRAWAIIVSYARAMPKTDRETELRGACLKFCKMNPTVTSRHIEKVLILHSKSTAEEQKRVVASVAEYVAGRETRALNGETLKNTAEGNVQPTLPPSALSRKMADTKPARPASQPASTTAKQKASLVEVTSVTASEKVSYSSLKDNPTMGNATARTSSPQKGPAAQVQQAPWHSRAWDMIANVARAMPRTDPENELRGACLQFCKKYPKATADYIEKVLSLHSKRTPEEQKRVVASVAEYIVGRG